MLVHTLTCFELGDVVHRVCPPPQEVVSQLGVALHVGLDWPVDARRRDSPHHLKAMNKCPWHRSVFPV